MQFHLRLISHVIGFVLLGSASSWAADCNGNGIPDDQDIAAGTSTDCDGNGVPDECEFVDCNNNGVHDACDALPIGVGTLLPHIIVPEGFEATIFAQLLRGPNEIEISEGEGFGSFIYVVNSIGVNRFARIDPAGVVTEFVVSPNVYSPQALVFGPRGNFDAGLYFTHSHPRATTLLRVSPSGGVVELFYSGLSGWFTLTFGFGDDLYLPNNASGIIRVDANLAISDFVPGQSAMLGINSLRYAPSSPYGPALFNADNNQRIVWRIDENANVTAFSEGASWRPRSLAFGTGGEFGFGLYVGSWGTPPAVFSLAPDGTASAFATGFLDKVEDIVFGKGNAFRRDMYIAGGGERRIIRIGPIRSADCNGNDILDECEIAAGTSADCNANGRLDLCEVADTSATDCNSNGIPDECEGPPAVSPTPEAPAFSKNRFLSFVPDSASATTALRVTLVDLPPPFDLFIGQAMWVGPTRVVSENGATVEPTPGSASFTAASLQCAALFQDWSDVGLIHVFHEFIVPGGSYEVQAITDLCDPADESSFSASLSISTSGYGDTVTDLGDTPPGPPDGSVNVVDALAVLGRFGSASGSITKARADLEPGCLDLKINISDVLSALAGFSGLSYPFTPTATDPCDSTCPNPLP